MSRISNQGGNVGQIDSMRDVRSVERADVGSIGGMRVEVGEGARQPSRAGEALNAVRSFFKDLGGGVRDAFATLKDKIQTAYQDYQTARADRAEARRMETFGPIRDALLEGLPSGVAIDDQGVISGSHVAHAFPNDPLLGSQAGQSLGDALEETGRSQLSPVDKHGQPAAMATIAGIPVTSQSVKDFYRIDLTLGSGNGAYKSANDATRNADRNESVVRNLKAFTGSDEAVTVLSSVVNQQFSRLFTDSWSKSDGSRSVCQVEQGRLGAVNYRAPDGSESMVQPGGIGTAPIRITQTQNGDFKVEINWDMYYSGLGRGHGKSDFPGMGDSVMRASGHIEFVVDGNAARSGQLSVNVTQPATITFEGRMAA